MSEKKLQEAIRILDAAYLGLCGLIDHLEAGDENSPIVNLIIPYHQLIEVALSALEGERA